MNSSAILTEQVMALRLCLGFLAGAIVGLERSNQRQVAGLRTHILIATGSTLLMLLSIYIPQRYMNSPNGDPSRIAAQVVSGIGFLGAGAIIRLGNNIRGLTTAASLWFVAAVGLAIGSGMYLIAGIAEALGLVTLFLLSIFEKRVFPTEHYKMLEISYMDNTSNTDEALKIITDSGIQVQSMDVNQGSKDKGTKLTLLVRIPSTTNVAAIARAIKSLGNVNKVEFKEKY